MGAMELSTAARAGLPVRFFVFDDGTYHYMQMLQEPAFRRTTATEIARINFAAFAAGVGLAYNEISEQRRHPRRHRPRLCLPRPDPDPGRHRLRRARDPLAERAEIDLLPQAPHRPEGPAGRADRRPLARSPPRERLTPDATVGADLRPKTKVPPTLRPINDKSTAASIPRDSGTGPESRGSGEFGKDGQRDSGVGLDFLDRGGERKMPRRCRVGSRVVVAAADPAAPIG